MLSPLRFNVEVPDDLLIWADLWRDWGEPAYAEGCRLLHELERWPRKHGNGVCWGVRSPEEMARYPHVGARRSNVDQDVVPFPCEGPGDSRRAYANTTLAFLDLLSHMAWAK